MNKKDIFFINENYDILPGLLGSVDYRSRIVNSFEKVSVEKAIQYQDEDTPSGLKKDFYDLNGLIVAKEIADIFLYFEPYGMNIIPVEVSFNDEVKVPYYRIDTFLSHDLIDMNRSVIKNYNENNSIHDFSEVFLSQEKVDIIPDCELDFFIIKGMHAEQYAVSKKISEKLKLLNNNHIVISDKYEVMW